MNDKLKESLEGLRTKALGDEFPHPLSGTIYKGDPKPKASCVLCMRSAEFLANMQRGLCECSHVQCPNRKKAWASDIAGRQRGGVPPESES